MNFGTVHTFFVGFSKFHFTGAVTSGVQVFFCQRSTGFFLTPAGYFALWWRWKAKKKVIYRNLYLIWNVLCQSSDKNLTRVSKFSWNRFKTLNEKIAAKQLGKEKRRRRTAVDVNCTGLILLQNDIIFRVVFFWNMLQFQSNIFAKSSSDPKKSVHKRGWFCKGKARPLLTITCKSWKFISGTFVLGFLWLSSQSKTKLYELHWKMLQFYWSS